MSHRNFAISLLLVIAAGFGVRGCTSRLPDLNADEYVRRGDEIEKAGDRKEAIRYYTAALVKSPRHVAALNSRAIAQLNQRQVAKALADLEQAIYFSNGKSRDSFVVRSFIYHIADQYDEALADATKAIELDPTKVDGYLLRSSVLRHPHKGNKARAEGDWAKALALDPTLKDNPPLDLGRLIRDPPQLPEGWTLPPPGSAK